MTAETITACAKAAIRDLRGSINPEALPEMAVWLAQVRLAERPPMAKRQALHRRLGTTTVQFALIEQAAAQQTTLAAAAPDELLHVLRSSIRALAALPQCWSRDQLWYAATAVGRVGNNRSGPMLSASPYARRSSSRSCLTLAIANTMPRR